MVAESSADYIMMLDLDFKIQFINRTEEGLTKEQVIGTPLYLLVEEKDQSRVKRAFEEVVQKKLPINYETTYIRPDNSTIYYESIASPIIIKKWTC